MTTTNTPISRARIAAEKRFTDAQAAVITTAAAHAGTERARLDAIEARAAAKIHAAGIMDAARAACKEANRAEYKARLAMLQAQQKAAWAAGKLKSLT